MNKIFITLTCFVSLASAHEWAYKDLTFVRNTITANHPGMHNTEDPTFCTNLELFFQEAQQQLQTAASDDECKSILRAFSKQFNDAHLGIQWLQAPSQNATVNNNKKPQDSFSGEIISPDSMWVRIRTFMPQEQDITAMQAIINTMVDVRNIPCIVFDLRGNGGGNSNWGKQIANALFGESYADMHRAQALAAQYIEWRASTDNINYWRTEAIPYVKTTIDVESEALQWAQSVLEGMQKAYDAADVYYRENTIDTVIPTSQDQGASLYSGTIIAVIDGSCASACLNFIDELKMLGTRVILVGQQTMADSLYMEVRTIQLPSGHGLLRMPIKVFRNRPRGHNVPYIPDAPYAGDIKDTKAIQEWVLQFVHE